MESLFNPALAEQHIDRCYKPIHTCIYIPDCVFELPYSDCFNVTLEPGDNRRFYFCKLLLYTVVNTETHCYQLQDCTNIQTHHTKEYTRNTGAQGHTSYGQTAEHEILWVSSLAN